MLEDRRARALREEVLDTLAKTRPGGLRRPRGRTSAATTPIRLLLEIAQHRDGFAAPFDPNALAAALGAEPETTPAELGGEVLDPGGPRRASSASSRSSPEKTGNDRKAADDLRAALAAP